MVVEAAAPIAQTLAQFRQELFVVVVEAAAAGPLVRLPLVEPLVVPLVVPLVEPLVVLLVVPLLLRLGESLCL